MACLMLAACASAPAPRQIQNSFPIDQPFEKVWQAVIETFAELNLPIMNMEKASGLITTDWIDFRGQKDETGYCSCGKAGFPFSEIERKGKFNVYVKKMGEASCEIRVNSSFEATAAYQDAIKRISCISTGNLEKEIYDRVLEKAR